MRHLPSPARSRLVSSALAAFALMGSSTAFPRAQLVSSSPPAEAKVSDVKTISLTFSEGLIEKMSGIDLTMTGMPGMANHAPMAVSGFKTAVGAEGRMLTVTLPRALPVGTYTLKYHAVTADTHRVEGSYSFSVK